MKGWADVCKKKIIAPEYLGQAVEQIRQTGKTIATLNGSFDLIHAGHLHIIYEASQQADILIIALNSDHSVKKYKSGDRPLIPLEQRLQMVAALEFVDYATWFEEVDPIALLSIIKPDVHVNGSEYGKNCLESEIVQKNGGRIHIVSLIPGLSTSQLILRFAKV